MKTRASLTPEQRRGIMDQLFFEGAARGPFVRQFYALLALSTTIATAGLLLDSTAVVQTGRMLSPMTYLDEGMTVPELDNRLTATLGHDVVLEVIGSFGFLVSTCDDPDGCG